MDGSEIQTDLTLKPGTVQPGFCMPCMFFTYRVRVPGGPGSVLPGG